MSDKRKQLEYQIITMHAQGQSLRQIARSTGLSRPTIRKILEEMARRRAGGETAAEREVPKSSTPRGSMLDEHQERMRTWLQQYPNLTAQRMLEKLRDVGYEGGYTMVRLAVVRLRAPQPKEKQAYEVIETAIGQQCQFDWSPYKLEGGEVVQAWCCVLSWSRARHMALSTNTRQTTILRMLQQSFELLGGVPSQSVTDSMPGVVDRWENDEPVLNIRFVDFAAYYGFTVDISPRSYPEYKGKVERCFWHTECSFLNGRTFHTIEQMRSELEVWLMRQEREGRHPETDRPLFEMHAEERGFLRPLPGHAYDTRDVVVRIVDTQGYVQFETNEYRVPDKVIGKRVYLCVGENSLEMVDGSVHRVAEHARLASGSRQRVGLPGIRERHRYDLELLQELLNEWGPDATAFIAGLQKEKRYWGRHMARLLALQNEWALVDILSALAHAVRYHAMDAGSVERILRARHTPLTRHELIAKRTQEQVRMAMKEHPVPVRPLREYDYLCGIDNNIKDAKQENINGN